MDAVSYIELTNHFAAHNYSPLDVVIQSGEGVWVTDTEGRKYLDLLSAYSALNFGHRNPRLIKIAREQLEKITLPSRAFYSDKLALFVRDLAALCGKDKILPMTSGAEAVETAIKAARKWSWQKKGIAEHGSEIICFVSNFHGRTTTALSLSSSEESRAGFGPFTPGFKLVPYGDPNAVEQAIGPTTSAVLFEPILGEGGVIIPPVGFLTHLREICNRHKILMIADEIQTGLCRTGEIFACNHERVEPDIYIVGKSLAGGITPLSAIAANDEIMSVFAPGTHGSTFGGNALACAVACEVIALIREEAPHKRAAELGAYFLERLKTLNSPVIREVRGKGLLLAIEIKNEAGPAKKYCEKLKNEGLLCKDTRQQTIRFAPPLVITKDELDWAFERLQRVFLPSYSNSQNF